MGIFHKHNNRRQPKFIGKNIWVRADLFKNTPLLSIQSGGMFGLNSECWVRILGEDKNNYLVNVTKINPNSDETGDIAIEVTKDEIKKILTTKCKLSKASVDILEPLQLAGTDELFKVVEEHTQPDYGEGFIDDDYDEDGYDEDEDDF